MKRLPLPSCPRFIATLITLVASMTGPHSNAAEYDVVVYGATPAGITASLSAAEAGHTVFLVEPSSRIGGLITNGLSHPDFRTFESITGAYLDFTTAVQTYYESEYGVDSPQAKAALKGTEAEPKVNLLIFQQMLAKYPDITVEHNLVLTEVEVAEKGNNRRIVAATFTPADQRAEGSQRVSGKVFIDATYEGDLLAHAGVDYRVGRESREEYNESLAPPKADGQVQGYNFRLIVTQDPSNRVLASMPSGYRRDDFIPVLQMFAEGKLKSVFCSKKGGIFKAHLPPLPNGKHDVNDVSRGVVRLSMPSINDSWPEGPAQTREELYNAHVRHSVGLLYFLQHDSAVPKAIQAEARDWGWCKDEFVENGHIPVQLYVREGRRMIGQHVYTQNDTNWAPGDARSKLHTDSIAIGDYSHNCHGTGHEGPIIGGKHTGEFYKGVAPYQIPYGVLVPRDKCSNLLVPCACSSSHVGFCALRLEPIWMSLGQAAGLAAHLAIHHKSTVPDVDVLELQTKLHTSGSATIYVSDVPPGHPLFSAVQWWGTNGGLHGLAPKGKIRGKFIAGQYYEAYHNHDVNLDSQLTAELRTRWLNLAESLSLNLDSLRDAKTRGEFISRAYGLQHETGNE